MKELKGNWKDLFNGFMLALDLRKMFLGFCGILFSFCGPLAATAWVANLLDREHVRRPETLGLHDLYATLVQSFEVIYVGTSNYTPHWTLWVPHALGLIAALVAIWAYFGGAIARIAAYEIAKDGERIETVRALGFAREKFWSFFMSPWICVMGFAFFFLCNLAGGLVGRIVDFVLIGAPLVALLLPLALLSGFIMTLIALGTAGGLPLFVPAVAAEGTDAFDAVSRGFSYVYSRPWHYLWYQAVAAIYGVVCVGFVTLFAVGLCHTGLKAGSAGFDLVFVRKALDPPQPPPPPPPPTASQEEKDRSQKQWNAFNVAREGQIRFPDKYAPVHDRFSHVADVSWALILTDRYDQVPLRWEDAQSPVTFVYKAIMKAANGIVRPDYSIAIEKLDLGTHRFAAWIVLSWLLIALGITLGYVPAYVLSQQTLIYYLLRKKVDGIEMNEVFEETEEEALPPEPQPESPPAEPAKDQPVEPPKSEEKK
ncbi:MAG: hypothetical protein HY716_12395 [Planctomycetes bacterium]|nr:hypothetical protein [Planctomycetota bacterium]